MDAVLLAVLAGALMGAMGVALRFGLRRVPDAEVAAFHSVFVGFLVSLVLTAATGRLEGIRFAEVWPFLALGVLVPGLSQILFVRGIRDIGPSRAMLITGTAPLLAAIAAILFLDEPLRAGLAAGTVLVVVGIATLAWDKGRPEGFRAFGVVWVLASLLMFVVRDVLARWLADDRAATGLVSATALLGAASATLVLYLAVARRGRRPLAAIGHGAPAFLTGGVLFGLGYDALLEAFARGKVTVVSPLNGTYAFWGVVFAALLLRRSEMVGRRLVLAAVLIVGGGALVGLARGDDEAGPDPVPAHATAVDPRLHSAGMSGAAPAERLHFTGDDDADRLLAANPFALLVGFALDQQVPLQKAFSGPLELERRLGSLDPRAIAALDPRRLEAVFREKPAIHRFPASMARRVQELAATIVEEYGGDAGRVWREAADGAELERRLFALPGFGEMKVRSLAAVLGKRLGVRPDGWERVAADHFCLGDVDSPAKLAEYQAAKRAHKAAIRAGAPGR